MEFKIFIIIILSIIGIECNAQNNKKTENKNNLYWHKNVEVNYSHFQSESNVDCIKYNKKYGFKMSGNIQLAGIVDIPKSHLSKRIRKRKGNDKAYIAPIFLKNRSCMISKDSLELMVYKLHFDVAEMSSRGMRKELYETKEQMGINNVNTMFFTTTKNKWVNNMRRIWASIYQEILIQKKEGSYEKWRKLVDQILLENEKFATKLFEIDRLMKGRPVENNYIQAETIIGDLKNNRKN